MAGYLDFVDGLRIIVQGARSGDPYADWWQFKVDATLVNASSTPEAVCSVVDAHMGAVEGFTIEAAASVQPTRVRLQFSNPYVYRGAQLLAAYDGLARQVLSAQHVGLIEREAAERLLHQGAKPIRRAFASAAGYRLPRITLADVAQRTERAKQAYEAMGELPADIVSGALRAELTPKRPDTALETASQPTPTPVVAKS